MYYFNINYSKSAATANYRRLKGDLSRTCESFCWSSQEVSCIVNWNTGTFFEVHSHCGDADNITIAFTSLRIPYPGTFARDS